MLQSCFKNNCLEAGLDEAGRGCLAGPVFAAAVILPPTYKHPLLRDSKTLSYLQRVIMKKEIEDHAICFSIQKVDEITIDKINILRASIKAMHKALSNLSIQPEHIVVDGNYFIPFKKIPYQTIIKGDNTFMNIAAASILAKTYRDEWMLKIHKKHPDYQWAQNKGYGTKSHIDAIRLHGLTPYHRRSFHVKSLQLPLFQDIL